MALKSKSDILGYFFPGAKPTATQFHNFIDSVPNLNDPVNTEFKGSITLGDFPGANAPAGTLAWRSNSLQLCSTNNGTFAPLASGGFQPVSIPTATPIGTGITVDALQTQHGLSIGAINTAVTPASFQNAAVFANKSKFTVNDFALLQEPNGTTWLNAAAGRDLKLAIGRTEFIKITDTATTSQMDLTIKDVGTPRFTFRIGNAAKLTIGKLVTEFAVDAGVATDKPEFVFRVGTARAFAIRRMTSTSIRANATDPNEPPASVALNGSILQIYGDFHFINNSNAWASSDARLKKDILPFEQGLDKLMNIRPVQFKYNGMGETTDGRAGIGVLAQEIEQILPYTVKSVKNRLNPDDEKEEDLLLFDSSPLLYVMINSIKELVSRIKELEIKLA